MDEDYNQKNRIFQVKVQLDKGRAFEGLCKNEDKTVNAKLKELIDNALKGQKRYFASGKNIIRYDKSHNNFSWLVKLDSGQEVEVLNNLSTDFLKNLKNEIEQSIQERNDWVHQRNQDSVEIPKEILGGGE